MQPSLDKKVVESICSMLDKNVKLQEIASIHGTSLHVVSCISRGLTYKSASKKRFSPRKKFFDDSDVLAMHSMVASGKPIKDVAAQFGIRERSLLDICAGKTYKHLKLVDVVTKAPLTVKERLLKRVKVDDMGGCWNWTGAKNIRGYGQIRVNGAQLGAHRVSYEVFYGPLQERLCVLHSCDNPACVNPSHLSLGTNKENSQDMISKKRQCYGDRNARSVLRSDQVSEIRNLLESKTPVKQIADKFSVSKSCVEKIRTGRTWKY